MKWDWQVGILVDYVRQVMTVDLTSEVATVTWWHWWNVVSDIQFLAGEFCITCRLPADMQCIGVVQPHCDVTMLYAFSNSQRVPQSTYVLVAAVDKFSDLLSMSRAKSSVTPSNLTKRLDYWWCWCHLLVKTWQGHLQVKYVCIYVYKMK